MSDYTIFADRGEVAVKIDGVDRPARPSYEAQVAIEQQLGVSIDELFLKARRLAEAASDTSAPVTGAGFKLMEMATVITECVKAAGKARSDSMLMGWRVEVVAEKIAADRFAMNAPVTALLMNALFGGADPKKADPPSPAA
jgi:hypothetical protein